MTQKTEKTLETTAEKPTSKRPIKTNLMIAGLLVLIALGSFIGYSARVKKVPASAPQKSAFTPPPQTVRHLKPVMPMAEAVENTTPTTLVDTPVATLVDTASTQIPEITPTPVEADESPALEIPLAPQTDAPKVLSLVPLTPATPAFSEPALNEPLKAQTDEVAQNGAFTLAEALAFRDRLTSGASCRTDLERVIQIHPRTPLLLRVIESTEPFCVSSSADASPFDAMNASFRTAQKAARFSYYRANDPVVLAYLKSLAAAFVEIRKLEADDTTPIGILDRAEAALEKRQPAEVLAEIQKLPPVYQVHFADFKAEAQAYLTAQKNLNALLLSFDKTEN